MLARSMLIWSLVALSGGVCLADGTILKGAGATFPHPLYRKWVEVYQRQTGVRINYEAIGSGAGIRALVERRVDFGATDAFLSDAEMAAHRDAPILHIPTCLGAVAVIYNLPGNPSLRFSPQALSGLFLGEITNWSDARLRRDNPETPLPDLPVQVVHRSESSGTTFIFTDFLAKVDDRWRDDVGRGKKVRWPGGMGVEGNPQVASFVKKIPGSVGYVSLSYARANNLPAASLQNRSGNFVKPTLEAVSDAAQTPLPRDARVLITDSPVAPAYPIAAFTYLIVYREQSGQGRSLKQARTLVDFIQWALADGQDYCEELNYSRLSAHAAETARAILARIEYKGKPILAQPTPTPTDR